MKRFLTQSTTAAAEPALKRPQSVLVQQNTGDATSTAAAVAVKVVPGQPHVALDTYLKSCTSLLTREDKHHLENIVTGEWVMYDTIMYKLHHRSTSLSAMPSTAEKRDAKGGGAECMVAFDMDETVIKTKSGKIFSETTDDWTFWDTVVPSVLKEEHERGSYVALISNQIGVKKGRTTIADIQEKVDKIMKRLEQDGVAVDFICALDDDKWRKPRTAMWEFLMHFGASNAKLSDCVYVGDAAGRPKEGLRKKDFSDSDLKMALNMGVKFLLPEQYFYKRRGAFAIDLDKLSGVILAKSASSVSISASALSTVSADTVLLRPCVRASASECTSIKSTTSAATAVLSPPPTPEIVLLVAPASCGKSTLSDKFVTEKNYVRINQDALGNVDKCLTTAEKHLAGGKASIVVDNTNTKAAVRKKWVELAVKYGVSIRCIVLDVPKEVCFALQKFRLLDPRTDTADRRKIEDMVIHGHYKNMEPPLAEREGFECVDVLTWNPKIPFNAVSARLFGMYL